MDFSNIEPKNGCLPIFYISVTAFWRNVQASKQTEPKVTRKIVYKGRNNVRPTEDLKKAFFKASGMKKPTNVNINSFTITEFKILAHLGYEVNPSENK